MEVIVGYGAFENREFTRSKNIYFVILEKKTDGHDIKQLHTKFVSIEVPLKNAGNVIHCATMKKALNKLFK